MTNAEIKELTVLFDEDFTNRELICVNLGALAQLLINCSDDINETVFIDKCFLMWFAFYKIGI